MPEYTVTWTMAFDAEDPWDAAEQALAVHRDPDSTATVFRCQTEGLNEVEIDLTEGSVDGHVEAA
jgi:hypothetical protein